MHVSRQQYLKLGHDFILSFSVQYLGQYFKLCHDLPKYYEIFTKLIG